MTRRAYVLAGPTASGKSAIAQILAERHDLRILSADSMLVYRGMDIGTAKPTPAERARAVYAGLDLAGPADAFNTSLYLRAVAGELSGPGWDRPFLVTGGTGLYLKALLHGFDPPGEPDPRLRRELEELHAASGVKGLQDRLRALAPERLAALADPANPRRLVRAIETASGTSARPGCWSQPAEIPPVPGLEVPPAALADRISRRVEAMFEGGLLEETRALRLSVPLWSATALQAIGYAEAMAVLDGRMSVAVAREQTAARTRRLAKRQRTWLRNQERLDWVPVTGSETPEDLASRVWERLLAGGGHVLQLPAVEAAAPPIISDDLPHPSPG